MTQEELEKLSISDVYYILMNEKEYYSAEELAMLEKRKRELDRKYDEEEYNKEIENRPEEFRCPKCDGINKSSGKECVFCGYRFKRNDYFNGKDITLNVCIQIRAVVDELQKRLNVSFEDAMLMFYRSETYKTLQETENAFWAESAEYIADRYFEEMDIDN